MSANKTHRLMVLGRPAQAERTLREALTLAERIATPRLLTLRSVATTTYYHLGRWDDALVELEIALELLEDRPVNDYEIVHVHGLAALIATHRDDQATLRRHLTVQDNLPPGLRTYPDDDFRLARALVAEQAGNVGVAVEVLASFVRLREHHPQERDRPYLLPTLVRLALAAGDLPVARWATTLCGRDTNTNEGPYASGAARHCHGLLDANPADLLAAVDSFRSIATIPALAGSLEDLAVVHGQRGELQAARAAYAEAVELYQSLGAACDLARARSRTLPYGIGGRHPGKPTRPASGWYALTRTERRIAHLVAKGLSNPDIAAELFLSRRTVQSHVSHILNKLDVRSRVEIAEEATRHPGSAGPADADPA